MLVTGLGASVALADEPEAAQQTTQSETTQQESGTQQPTAESGDVADEADVNAGDQADQTQNADGDEGAEGTEPGDGGSEESDQTEEPDADKADGAAKKVAPMPAPQSADSNTASVQPRSTSKTLTEENRPSTSDKVKVYAFDYDGSNINNGHTLRFNGGNGEGIDINQYQNDVRQGIVDSQLDENGYPKLKDGESLAYLFNNEQVSGKTSYTNNGNGLDGLFTFDENTGYYEYDSAKNYATLVGSDGQLGNKFRVYDQGRFESSWDPTKAFGYGAFLPFNDLEKDGQNYFNDKYRKDNFYGDFTNGFGGTNGYLLDGQTASCHTETQGASWWEESRLVCSPTDDGYANYHFGMSVGAEFYMPEDRKVNNENMVFEFGGDDDVWVFLDGHLVMDLGGIHDYRTGSIDFTNGIVSVQNKDEVKLDELYGSHEWADDSTTHELKVFYLERGKGGSNCKFKFNLPTISSDEIQIAKKVTSGDNNDMSKTYQFKAYVSNDGESDPTLYNGEYVVCAIGSPTCGETKTTVNGLIGLKANEYAKLTDQSITVNATYYVTELDASAYTVTASGGAGQSVDVTPDENGNAKTNTVAVSAVPYLTVTNTRPLGVPTHRKSISAQCDEQCMYDLSLDVTGASTGSSSQQSADVVIVLDKSTSMNYNMNGDYQYGTSRWTTAKNAIGTLLDGLLGEGKDNRVSLVTFSGSNGWYDFSYNDAQKAHDWTSSKSDITGAYGSNPESNAGTNWEAGLREADKLLKDVREGASKYVVFVSDGDPTFYYNNDGSTGGTGRGDSDGTAYSHAVTQAKALDATVFSIGVGPQNNVKKMESFAKDVNGKDGYYYSGASESDLNKAVEDIVQAIRTSSSYTDVSITDTLSDYMDFGFDTSNPKAYVKVTAKYVDGFNHEGLPDNPATPKNVQVSINGKKITVSFPDFDLQNGVTYTVTFKVKPTQAAFDDATWTDGSTQSQAFPSNAVDSSGNGAYLTYTDKTITTGSTGGTSTTEKTVPYEEKPTFTVPASTVTVTKQWPEGVNHPDSVTIQLKRDNTDYEPVTLNDDNNWSHVFQVPAGPTGHKYSVEERSIEGWTPSYEYKVTTSGNERDSAVADDGTYVTLKGLCAQSAAATVSNAVNEVTYGVSDHLDLSKVFEGKDLERGAFSFKLENVTTSMGSKTDPAGMVFHEYSAEGTGDPVLNGDGTPATSVTVTNGNTSSTDVNGFDFGAISFTKDGTYYVKVSEVIPPDDDKEAGVVYDTHALYVKYVVTSGDSGLQFVAEQDRTIVDENGKPVDEDDQAKLLTWTNRFVVVSSLPLSGGRSTARTLLLSGGGVLLVAGAAWLLARRRRV